MANVFDAARYILLKTGEISTWKLQKLCYYAQAWTLAWTGKPLFPEDFEAWRNGPVCRPLFARHKGMYSVTEDFLPDGNIDALTADEKDSIDTVLSAYGDMEPYQLRAQTHAETPWKAARGSLDEMAFSDSVISKEAIGAYYGAL